ncbi:MAG: hypothetical protein DRR16_09525 [Candidatus Parabeggiatoa sp. nov. 3]|nr:MAG: hypothetical protein DRR00_14530 [Gammaproteobacteria bacterium]RKZ67866.1 MAG: hypothetical protein DRQ99_05480 [Gammaproteobacteria bacterium]RKZ86503.1 MAG: hypothetical protein DRR16_09525 [Gammaproteobacteria bacterium]
MKKIAIFVEGETECEFVSKFIKEVIGQKNISIDSYKGSGGKKYPRTYVLLAKSSITDEKYYALIYVSGTDNQVNHDIKRKLPTLKAQGFDKIVGLRDLRGEQKGSEMSLADLPKLELASKVIEKYCFPLATHIVIAVMEIETWFLAETNHYACIDEKLTKTKILSKLGFNPYTDDLTLRLKPAEDLKKLYQMVGKSYSKKRDHRERTIECLDYANIYIELKNRIVKLKELVIEIDQFFD